MKEQISALIDGELDESEARRVLDALNGSAALREEWRCYGLIGDCLRGEGTGRDLSASVMARLGSEPTVLAPVAKPRGLAQIQRPLAMAAAATAVAMVAWAALRSPMPSSAPGIASAPNAAVQAARTSSSRVDNPAYLKSRDGAQSAPGGYVRAVTERSAGK